MSSRFVQATCLALEYGHTRVKVRRGLANARMNNCPPHFRKRSEGIVNGTTLTEKPKQVNVCPRDSFGVFRVLRQVKR